MRSDICLSLCCQKARQEANPTKLKHTQCTHNTKDTHKFCDESRPDNLCMCEILKQMCVSHRNHRHMSSHFNIKMHLPVHTRETQVWLGAVRAVHRNECAIETIFVYRPVLFHLLLSGERSAMRLLGAAVLGAVPLAGPRWKWYPNELSLNYTLAVWVSVMSALKDSNLPAFMCVLLFPFVHPSQTDMRTRCMCAHGCESSVEGIRTDTHRGAPNEMNEFPLDSM